MSADRDPALVLDIAEACRLIASFVVGFDESRFRADPKTHYAVIFQLVLIGEAVKGLSPALRDAHPEQPWSDIARMRDRLTHHYAKTDLSEVWLTASRDIPELLQHLEPLLPSR